MILHRGLEARGPLVAILPPQRIPECTCKHTETLQSDLIQFTWFRLNLAPLTFLHPLLQHGRGHLQDFSQPLGPRGLSWTAAGPSPGPGSRRRHEEEHVAGVQAGGGWVHLRRTRGGQTRLA